MPKSPRQKEKLIRILEILERKTDEDHFITTKELINELAAYDIEAERKAIYDDILILQNMNYDITMNKGKNGGYALVSRKFNKSEIMPLVNAVSCSKFITEKKSRELISKLESFLSEWDAKTINRNVYVADRVKSDNESIYYSVDAVAAGIAEKKKISFLYCDWNVNKQLVPRHNNKRYTVSPISLTWDDEKYYLIAFSEEYNQIRHFRCDKMKDVTILEDKISVNDDIKNFDAVKYENRTFGMFSGYPEYVTLTFPESYIGVMVDRFGKEPSLRKEADGRISIRVNVNVSPQFYGWVSALGTEVRIKSPESVVDEYKKYLEKLLQNY